MLAFQTRPNAARFPLTLDRLRAGFGAAAMVAILLETLSSFAIWGLGTGKLPVAFIVAGAALAFVAAGQLVTDTERPARRARR